MAGLHMTKTDRLKEAADAVRRLLAKKMGHCEKCWKGPCADNCKCRCHNERRVLVK